MSKVDFYFKNLALALIELFQRGAGGGGVFSAHRFAPKFTKTQIFSEVGQGGGHKICAQNIPCTIFLAPPLANLVSAPEREILQTKEREIEETMASLLFTTSTVGKGTGNEY